MERAELVAEAIRLTKDGLSRQAAGKRLNVSRNVICGIIDKHRDQVPATKQKSWTPARILELRRLAGEGYSQRAISQAMKTSPGRMNSVIRRHCPDLVGTFKNGPPKKKRGFSMPQLGPGRGVSAGGGMGGIIARNVAAVAAYVPPPAEPPTPRMCGLLELTTHACRWPLGGAGAETKFCGAGQWQLFPYCEFHSRRGYIFKADAIERVST